ncbi:MAG: tripartite tricarboxylate transporter substrate binding protein [Betaproteobacteria bacterium]|nr:tripartite tricarboxylate transporter substrate binding protein [Betaproteobacteria bacterium]
MKFATALVALFAVAVALPAAGAQSATGLANYPAKPIRLVITYPPGGNTDLVGRAVAQKLVESLGQQVVVDNRGGAGGVLGTVIAKQAPADGYTLLLGTSAGMVLNPLLMSKLPYDALKDFAPVSLVIVNPQVLVVHPALAAGNVREFVALAKAKPGQLNFGSSGMGTPNHLGGEMLKAMAGIDIVHVPYKGGAASIADLIAGQVQLVFSSAPSVVPHVRNGRLKALAVGSAKRTPALPNVPTVAESGVPGYEYTTWYGIFAPGKTPTPIVARLNTEIVRILADPQLSHRFQSQGGDPASSTPAGLTAYMREETARWTRVIKTAGIKIE